MKGEESKIERIESTNNKTYSPEKDRKQCLKAYMNWTKENDEGLITEHNKGKNIDELARIFERSRGAISARLVRLGLPDVLQKKLENKLIGLAFRVIKRFIRDWQKSPYKWDREIDIQVEIASRIKAYYQKLGKDEMKASYKVNIKGFEQEQTFSRVCCEPLVFYKYEDGIRYPCYPDIVIYQNIEHPEFPPDKIGQKINWPMLWICEIKYWTEWVSTPKKDDWDTSKIKYLLGQEDGTKSACWLTFFRERALSGRGIEIKRHENNRLWECIVRLPAINKK